MYRNYTRLTKTNVGGAAEPEGILFRFNPAIGHRYYK